MPDVLTKEDVEKLLPHREPFLFVDRVLELEAGKRMLAARRFNANEDFFRGHFPGDPVVPGVILVEAMAQAAGILAYKTTGRTYEGHGAVLLRIEKVSFRRPVKPGEEVLLEVIFAYERDPVWKFAVTAKVDDKICADGAILAAFTEKKGT